MVALRARTVVRIVLTPFRSPKVVTALLQREREFLIDSQLVRIHLVTEVI